MQTTHQSNTQEILIVKIKTFDVVSGKFLKPGSPVAAQLKSHPPLSETSQHGLAQGQTSEPNSIFKPPPKEAEAKLSNGLSKGKAHLNKAIGGPQNRSLGNQPIYHGVPGPISKTQLGPKEPSPSQINSLHSKIIYLPL